LIRGAGRSGGLGGPDEHGPSDSVSDPVLFGNDSFTRGSQDPHSA